MTTNRTAIFNFTPDDEQIVLPIGDDAETLRHIEIFLTENLADGDDLDNLQIVKTHSNPDAWVATYRFDLADQRMVFSQQTSELDLAACLASEIRDQHLTLFDIIKSDDTFEIAQNILQKMGVLPDEDPEEWIDDLGYGETSYHLIRAVQYHLIQEMLNSESGFTDLQKQMASSLFPVKGE